MTRILLTGPIDAGKSAFCRKLIADLRLSSLTPTGILTLKELEADSPVRLRAVDIRSGENRLLAERTHILPEGSPLRAGSPEKTRRWVFHPETLEWGNRVMKESPSSDLFILDEAGILEFRNGRGWYEGMKRIDRGTDRAALVVVRPELIPAAESRWPGSTVLDLSEYPQAGRQETIRQIRTRLLPDRTNGSDTLPE